MNKNFHISIINRKIKIRNDDRYKGYGRPKKSDYENKTVIELQKELDALYNQKIDFAMLGK